jgi:hypothetical protein
MVRRREVEFVEVYIFIYNGLNEGSFYQVGACLQVGFCMRIGFLTSQLDLRSQVGTCYEGWIPHFSVGYENYKMGLVTES